MVVLTDGKSVGDRRNAAVEASKLKRRVERIVGVGFGEKLPGFIKNLRSIASYGEVLEIPDMDKLNEKIISMREKTCSKFYNITQRNITQHNAT